MIENLLMLLIATAVISGCTTIYEQPDPILGQWKFTFSDLPQGDPEGLLAIAKVEGVYSGTIANSTGEYELNDLLIEENDLVGSSFNYQGNTIGLSGVFEGTVLTGQTSLRNRTFNFAGEKVE